MKRKIIGICLALCASSFLFATKLDFVRGNVKLILDDELGSFNLYALTDSASQTFVPLLSEADRASLSRILVLIDKTVYQLKPGPKIRVSTDLLPDGARMVYTIKNKAEITLDFVFVPNANGPVNAVKVELGVKNISPQSSLFALKAVFNTWLGEFRNVHFSSQTSLSWNSEFVFNSMYAEKWLESSDGATSIVFLLDGGNITIPQYVLLANRDTLFNSSWNPGVQIGHPFNSFFSLNNSALDITWKQITLGSQSQSLNRFYITTAVNGEAPPRTLEGMNDKALSTASTQGTFVDSSGTLISIGAVTEEQLDPKYVADLLQRIKNLENNPQGIDGAEINRLNAELDLILSKFGR